MVLNHQSMMSTTTRLPQTPGRPVLLLSGIQATDRLPQSLGSISLPHHNNISHGCQHRAEKWMIRQCVHWVDMRSWVPSFCASLCSCVCSSFFALVPVRFDGFSLCSCRSSSFFAPVPVRSDGLTRQSAVYLQQHVHNITQRHRLGTT